MLRTIIYVHVNIILDFPITYKSTLVLCQLECACIYQTVNMAVFITNIVQVCITFGLGLSWCFYHIDDPILYKGALPSDKV